MGWCSFVDLKTLCFPNFPLYSFSSLKSPQPFFYFYFFSKRLIKTQNTRLLETTKTLLFSKLEFNSSKKQISREEHRDREEEAPKPKWV